MNFRHKNQFDLIFPAYYTPFQRVAGSPSTRIDVTHFGNSNNKLNLDLELNFGVIPNINHLLWFDNTETRFPIVSPKTTVDLGTIGTPGKYRFTVVFDNKRYTSAYEITQTTFIENFEVNQICQ